MVDLRLDSSLALAKDTTLSHLTGSKVSEVIPYLDRDTQLEAQAPALPSVAPLSLSDQSQEQSSVEESPFTLALNTVPASASKTEVSCQPALSNSFDVLQQDSETDTQSEALIDYLALSSQHDSLVLFQSPKSGTSKSGSTPSKHKWKKRKLVVQKSLRSGGGYLLTKGGRYRN